MTEQDVAHAILEEVDKLEFVKILKCILFKHEY